MATDDLSDNPPPIKKVEGATRSWRDVLKIHPAAELLPLMSKDELESSARTLRKTG